MKLTRQEYFQRQRDIGKSAVITEQETAKKIRTVTRKYVVPLVKEYFETRNIIFPVEELSKEIDQIIREGADKTVLQLARLQEEMEQSLQEKLGIPVGHKTNAIIKQKQLNASMKYKDTDWLEYRKKLREGIITEVQWKLFEKEYYDERPSKFGRQSFMPERIYGQGFITYRRGEDGKIIWDDIPLEQEFQKRHDLSTLVWQAVEDQEQKIFDVIRGGRAAGRDAKDIGRDLEEFINHRDGGKRVVGRWMGMFPSTEKGIRDAFKRDYLKEHGGLQYGTDTANKLLKQDDAKAWLDQKMEGFKFDPKTGLSLRGSPKLPDAVRQYSARLGKAGLDYRTIAVMRTKTAEMISSEQKKIAMNSDISSGLVDWILERGRDAWNCRCEDLAAGSPYHVNDMVDKQGNPIDCPLHTNCSCELRPRLKTDEEILATFREEMAEDLATIQGTQEQQDMLDKIEAVIEQSQIIDIDTISGAGSDNTTSLVKSFNTNDRETIINGFSREIPEIEKLIGIPQGRPATINEALNNVNPLFNPIKEIANRNCANSVVAYECQRNGYNVKALSEGNDNDESYIKNAFSAFNLKEGDIERATKGRDDLINKLNSARFPDGSRFIISQRWYNCGTDKPGHDYIAEKINGEVRFVDAQKHIDDAKHFLYRVQKDRKGNYNLYFARIDDKLFKNDLDLSRIVTTSNTKLDNSINKNIIYYKREIMTKVQAFELLKASRAMEPYDSNGDPVYRHIGEHTEGDHSYNWVVYWCSPEEPDDRSYAFMYYVDKKTDEVSTSSAPLCEHELAYIRKMAI